MKKAAHWRTDAFALWCWKRILRIPWTARRSKQTILKEINPEYTLEDSNSGKDWGQEEKGVAEDEMVGWYLQLNEKVFEQTPGDSEAQGNLACCSAQGLKESDMT